MNYQPFLDMNILVSDDLIAELVRMKPALILTAILLLFVFYMFVTAINSALRLHRLKRTRPYTVLE